MQAVRILNSQFEKELVVIFSYDSCVVAAVVDVIVVVYLLLWWWQGNSDKNLLRV